MNADTAIRLLALCIALASVEMLNGIVRTVLVVPRLGKARALQLGALTGCALVLLVCHWMVPPLGLSGWHAHLGLGLGLAAFMASFDLAIGRFVMRRPWRKLWPDFDPRTGNYLSPALAFLACAPALIGWLQGAAL